MTISPLLQRLDEVVSTNDTLAERMRLGAPHGSAVYADRQTGGRGRRGRHWFSPPGENLCISVGLRLGSAGEGIGRLPLAAGVGVASVLISEARLTPRLKWPNDVRIGGRKIAGILCESVDSTTTTVVVGIGLNLNTPADGFPAALQDRVTSVRAETGNEVAIEWWAPRIRTAVIEACERALHRPTAAWAAWRDLDESIGKHVSIERNGQRQNGVVKDVLVNGPLVVEINGAEVIVHGGEVRFVDEPPQPRWCPEDTVST